MDQDLGRTSSYTPAKLRLLGSSTGVLFSPVVWSADQCAKTVRLLPIDSCHVRRGCSNHQSMTPSAKSPELRPLHQRVLDALFQPDQSALLARIPKIRSLFTVSDIKQIITQVQGLLADEPTLLYVSAPCRVVSDLHGQFADLMRMFGWFGAPDGSIPWVFLGDYVDRTEFGVEVLLLLFALKIEWPDKIILLRGNHEISSINRVYGFKDEIVRKFDGRHGEALFTAFNNAFDYMPLAAIAAPPGYDSEPELRPEGQASLCPSRFLLVHGGIGRLESLDQISSVRRPVRPGTGDRDELVMLELVWSDPTPRDDLTGLLPNKRDNYCGKIVCYGADRVQGFCRRNNITGILRGHECIKEGFELAFGGRVITFFSAVNYGGTQENHGCILHLALTRDDYDRPSIEVRPIRLEAKPQRWDSDDSDYDGGYDDGDLTDLEPDQDVPEIRTRSPDQGPVQRQKRFQDMLEASDEADTVGEPALNNGAGFAEGISSAVIKRADGAGNGGKIMVDGTAATSEAPPSVSLLGWADSHGTATGEALLGAQLQSVAATAAASADPAAGRQAMAQAIMQIPGFRYFLTQSLHNVHYTDGSDEDGGSTTSSAAKAKTCSKSPDVSLETSDSVDVSMCEGAVGACGAPSRSPSGPKVIVAFPWDSLSNTKCATPPRPSRDAGVLAA